MWLPNSVISDVDKLARIHYVNRADCVRWNQNRDAGELRLLSGWCWTARDRSSFRQGFKSQTVAYRDAWYELVKHTAAPPLTRGRPRVVVRAVA